jgi:hypothetical protein
VPVEWIRKLERVIRRQENKIEKEKSRYTKKQAGKPSAPSASSEHNQQVDERNVSLIETRAEIQHHQRYDSKRESRDDSVSQTLPEKRQSQDPVTKR